MVMMMTAVQADKNSLYIMIPHIHTILRRYIYKSVILSAGLNGAALANSATPTLIQSESIHCLLLFKS